MEQKTDEDRIIEEIVRLARKLDMKWLRCLLSFAVGLLKGC